jgi:hypothetical protein
MLRLIDLLVETGLFMLEISIILLLLTINLCGLPFKDRDMILLP